MQNAPATVESAPSAAKRMARARTLVPALVWILALAVAALWPSAAAWARGGDHDRARAALQSGEVLPLATVLDRLRRQDPGEVLAVELELDDGRWIYEIRLLRPGGQLVRLEVDARTAEVLSVRHRREGR